MAEDPPFARLEAALGRPAERADALRELRELLPVCVRGLSWGDAPRRAACTALLRAWLATRAADDELDLSVWISTLCETLVGRDPSPEAELAADLLLLLARAQPERLATSLWIRWTEGEGPAFRRLVEQLQALDPSLVAAARREQPEKHPRPPAEVLGALAGEAGPFLLARGQTSPEPARAQRIGILHEAEVLFDGWVAPGDLEALAAGLAERGPLRRGEWDVMYATGWSLAWTDDGGPLRVWDREGLLVWQADDALLTRDGGRCRAAEVERVHAYLEEGWVVRGVRCELRGGGVLPVAEERDPISEIDPTYDGLNLMCEASWASSLATALARALGVPHELDPPL